MMKYTAMALVHDTWVPLTPGTDISLAPEICLANTVTNVKVLSFRRPDRYDRELVENIEHLSDVYQAALKWRDAFDNAASMRALESLMTLLQEDR